MKRVIIDLPDDFEPGQCDECPFSYENWDGLGSLYCVFPYSHSDCKLEVKEFVPVIDIIDDVFGQMRDADKQEQKLVSDFVESLSEPTGVNFYDAIDESESED